VVEAPGASLVNKYYTGAQLDGQSWDRAWFTHDRLADGGSLKMTMGPVPIQQHPIDPSRNPPSASSSPLSDFGCSG
jgi:putative alpha-1,2-mannosidase